MAVLKTQSTLVLWPNPSPKTNCEPMLPVSYGCDDREWSLHPERKASPLMPAIKDEPILAD
jgi:hypothetical protein